MFAGAVRSITTLKDYVSVPNELFFFFGSHPFLTIFGQGSSGGRTRLYNMKLRAHVSFYRGNVR